MIKFGGNRIAQLQAENGLPVAPAVVHYPVSLLVFWQECVHCCVKLPCAMLCCVVSFL